MKMPNGDFVSVHFQVILVDLIHSYVLGVSMKGDEAWSLKPLEMVPLTKLMQKNIIIIQSQT